MTYNKSINYIVVNFIKIRGLFMKKLLAGLLSVVMTATVVATPPGDSLFYSIIK